MEPDKSDIVMSGDAFRSLLDTLRVDMERMMHDRMKSFERGIIGKHSLKIVM